MRPSPNTPLPLLPPPPPQANITHPYALHDAARGAPPSAREVCFAPRIRRPTRRLVRVTPRPGHPARRRALSSCRAAWAPPPHGAWSWSASSQSVPAREASASTTR
ncbi:hypothetical protein BDA96_05G028100 [Sorghum bicolor]|uniref:Uncharacterized protein n=1 Tax=Sorghum bicolor TaxID=4558 RepID=A0A921QXJ4_SORBI|nr:hypothetical protein BDA96_05G028100 [Sorghum bicolor]